REFGWHRHTIPSPSQPRGKIDVSLQPAHPLCKLLGRQSSIAQLKVGRDYEAAEAAVPAVRVATAPPRLADPSFVYAGPDELPGDPWPVLPLPASSPWPGTPAAS